ncbi:unnamed protein product [Phytophthora fragariaefolia]|uniref:Unnamed protein product n=1 Tax=Phytophthora fragariaefolia TaxID=1490495 RepID=A0A9W6Y4J2_9STRA|nr:unnamed protein product [Phytophthora fragariaefolia]
MGFRPCTSDACEFVKQVDASPAYIGVYVDDMLIGAKNKTIIAVVKRGLASYFKIKDIGSVTYVLGVKVVYSASNGTLVLSQKVTIERLVERYNQTSAHVTYNPNVLGEILLKRELNSEEVVNMERGPYRSLVGSLFSNSCTAIHKAPSDIGLHYQVNRRATPPIAFSDADWASDKQDRKSVSGVLVVMNGVPVIYKSKLQRTVALSSAEAEYIALSLCLKEIVWLRSLLEGMGANVNAATVVLEDNQSAIAIATNGGNQSRSKHIYIRHHFIREHVTQGPISLQYIPTRQQLTDTLPRNSHKGLHDFGSQERWTEQRVAGEC